MSMGLVTFHDRSRYAGGRLRIRSVGFGGNSRATRAAGLPHIVEGLEAVSSEPADAVKARRAPCQVEKRSLCERALDWRAMSRARLFEAARHALKPRQADSARVAVVAPRARDALASAHSQQTHSDAL